MPSVPIKFRIVLFGLVFIGSSVGLSLLGQQFPFMAKGTLVATVLLYVWAALMCWLIYAFFVVPLLKQMRSRQP